VGQDEIPFHNHNEYQNVQRIPANRQQGLEQLRGVAAELKV